MIHNDLPFETLDQLPTQQILNFEYGALEAETRIVVQQYTNEIKTLMRRNSQEIIDIGQKLMEVKQYLGHGNFRNWLKLEFNWSVSAATKFMQVAQQFKCVNFTHLNVTASTLYLIAAPSTPKRARAEVLERASHGENISYSKAKAIVCQHRKIKKGAAEPKTALLKSDEPVNIIELTRYETTSAISSLEDLTEKDAITETRSLSLPSTTYENKQIATAIKDLPEDTAQIPTSIENLVEISHFTSDTVLAEMVISIKNLTPEQLTRMIILAADTGLNEYQLSAIVTASQHALSTRVE